MESPDPQPSPPAADPSSDVAELRQQARDFNTLFNATFVGLIALALAVNLSFGKQMRMQQWENERVKPKFTRDDREYRQSIEPEIHRVMGHLQVFAATHPGYQSNVLSRYRVVLAEFFSPTPASGQSPVSPQGVPRPAGR